MPDVLTRTRPDFSRQDAGLRELMDDPDHDLGALRRTDARCDVVDSLLAGRSATHRRRLLRLDGPDRPSTLLDVGSGVEDVPDELRAPSGPAGSVRAPAAGPGPFTSGSDACPTLTAAPTRTGRTGPGTETT